MYKNNNIDSPILISNTRVYFEDSGFLYKLSSNKPLLTILKIYEFWKYDNTVIKDTSLNISLDLYYGSSKKAKNKMLKEYRNLKVDLEERFPINKPFAAYAESKIAEGENFYLDDREKNSRLYLGWSNGGCFTDYHLTMIFLINK